MFTQKMKIVLLLFVLFCLADYANTTPRWRILDSGAIEWQITVGSPIMTILK